MSCRLMFAFIILATTTTGSRLKPVLQHADTAHQAKGSHIWKKDKMYFCTKKWTKSTGAYTNKWCLAEIDEVLRGTEKGAKKMTVSQGFSNCVAKSKDYKFKVCNMKGKEDRRLNYDNKVYVAKSCFVRLPPALSYTTPDGIKVPILAAAVGYKTCAEMQSWPKKSQKRLTKPADYENDSEAATTTTTVVDEIKPIEPIESAEDTTTTTVSELASVDEDSLDVDTEAIAADVIKKILAEEQERQDELDDTSDIGDIEDEHDPVDNAVEESLETTEVEEDKEKSAEFDVDALAVNEIRALWRKRVQEQMANQLANRS